MFIRPFDGEIWGMKAGPVENKAGMVEKADVGGAGSTTRYLT